MQTTQIDPTHTPERFFLPRDTGEVLIDTETLEETPIIVYDVINEELDIRDTVSYRRKALDGYQDLRIFGDRTELWHNDVLVAESKVYMEYQVDEKWVRFDFGSTTPEKVVDTLSVENPEPDSLKASATVGDASLLIEALWQGGDVQIGKQSFTIEYPHQIIRCVWIITIHDATNLNINYDDYQGNVEDDNGETLRTIIFEPKGVQDKLVVDPYIQVEDNVTSIVVSTSEDEITFTCATANAVLKINQPNMVQVHEDYYLWTIYDNRMHRWRHDTGDTTTGMAGNDYSAIQVSGEWYWYPLTSSENTNSSAITTQLQNSNDATVNTGSAVTDLNMPDIFDSDDGLASDGARHIDSASQQGKITLGQNEIEPVIVDHNFGFRSGSTPDDHLVGHWKCDDNAATKIIVATIGSNAASGNNTNGLTSTDTVRGSGLEVNAIDDDIISLPASSMTYAQFKKHTVIIKIKTAFVYDLGWDTELYRCFIDTNGFIRLFYNVSSDCFTLQINLTGTITEINSPTYSSDTPVDGFHTIKYAVNLDEVFAALIVDSEIATSSLSGTIPPSTLPDSSAATIYEWGVV
jgi:hypothetical protein